MTPKNPDSSCSILICSEAERLATISAELRSLTGRVDELREDKREAHEMLAEAVKAQGLDLRAALTEQTKELRVSIEKQAVEIREMSDTIKSWKLVVTILWAVLGFAATLIGWHFKGKA